MSVPTNYPQCSYKSSSREERFDLDVVLVLGLVYVIVLVFVTVLEVAQCVRYILQKGQESRDCDLASGSHGSPRTQGSTGCDAQFRHVVFAEGVGMPAVSL